MRLSALAFALLLAFALVACGQSIPTFPPVPYDSGIECTSGATPPPMDGSVAPHDGGSGGTRSCAAGQVCVSGHCYAPCAMDSQCGDNETCTGGICTGHATGPHDGGPDTGPVDSGPVDSGPPDPCAHVMCTDVAAPACNPVTATCVQCAAPDGCGSAAAPVCDLAQGVCRPFVASLCAPCKVNADCAGIVAGLTFECTMHTHPFEKVCLPLCSATASCPPGMGCDTDGVHCVPRLGTCTHWFAAAGSRSCMGDADCAPLGATSADYLFAGVCSGGHCAQPCGVDGDCQSTTQTCPTGTICM